MNVSAPRPSLLSDLEAVLLDELRRRASGSRVEFDLEELLPSLAGRLGVSPSAEAVEEALLSLERKGYLRLLHVPPTSKAIRKEVERRLTELNIALLSGELDPATYREKVAQLLSLCNSLTVKPLPSDAPRDIVSEILTELDGLENLRNLEGLGGIGESTAKELEREYLERLALLMGEAGELLSAVEAAVEELEERYSRLQREIEIIKLDSRVRGVDGGLGLKMKAEELKKIGRQAEAIRRGLGLAPRTNPEEKSKLILELSMLRRQRELLRVKIQVEGRAELRSQLAALETRIFLLEKKIKELEAESMSPLEKLSAKIQGQQVLPAAEYEQLAGLIVRLNRLDARLRRLSSTGA